MYLHAGEHVTLRSHGDGQCVFIPITDFEFTEVSYWIHADGLSGSGNSFGNTLFAANTTVVGFGVSLKLQLFFLQISSSSS